MSLLGYAKDKLQWYIYHWYIPTQPLDCSFSASSHCTVLTHLHALPLYIYKALSPGANIDMNCEQ
jgi:hypothetical protein